MDGSVRITELQRSDRTCRLVVRFQGRPGKGALSARERNVFRRLAVGHCQKLVAFDFGLAHTTISSHLRGALDKLGLARWEHAVLLAAAIEEGGARLEPLNEMEPSVADGAGPYFLIRLNLSEAALRALTLAEREVALLVVDGSTNAEIGRMRGCSPRTVANQISSVFRKLGVHGRCELIRLLTLSSPGPDAEGVTPDIAPQSEGRRYTGSHETETVEILLADLPAAAG